MFIFIICLCIILFKVHRCLRSNFESLKRKMRGGVDIGREEFKNNEDENYDGTQLLQRNLDGGGRRKLP